MEIQFHPASRRGAVRSLVLGDRGEKARLVLAGFAAVLAVSLWFTVPSVCGAVERAERSTSIAETSRRRAPDGVRARGPVERDLASRALDAGDLVEPHRLSLRCVPASRWPRSLNPEAGWLSASGPRGRGGRAVRVHRRPRPGASAGRRARAVRSGARRPHAVADSAVDRSRRAGRPASGLACRPGPASEEFFAGVDLAAPAGSAVVAPADGVVVFAGRSPPALMRSASGVRQPRRALARAGGRHALRPPRPRSRSRRGQRSAAGARLGTVGTTGWTMFPALHYEYWRRRRRRAFVRPIRGLRMLDLRRPDHDVSLEKMRATSAPAADRGPCRHRTIVRTPRDPGAGVCAPGSGVFLDVP